MKKYNFYNIHNIIRMCVSKDISYVNDIDSHLNFFKDKSGWENPETKSDIVIKSFESFSYDDSRNEIFFDDYVFNNNFLIRSATKFAVNLSSSRLKFFMSNLTLPINLILQLALLKKGYSFLHCAAMSVDNKSFLLPAFGGVGKTSIISSFASEGEKIFGDDLCIIGNNRVYSYPQDMSIYEYHLKIFNNLPNMAFSYFRKRNFIKSLILPFTFFGKKANKLINIVLSRYYPEAINIPLVDVFGKKCISDAQDINYIIKLNKSSYNDSLKLDNLNKDRFVEFCSSVVLNEWSHYYNILFLLEASVANKNTFSIEKFFKDTSDVFKENFDNANLYEFNINYKTKPSDINNNFKKILNSLK
tara:strand:+ start:88 stop:1164 length:1077 start_codon:yes stop_codon:yes gene_type:complete